MANAGLTELYRGEDPVVEHVNSSITDMRILLMRVALLPYTDSTATRSRRGQRRDQKNYG